MQLDRGQVRLWRTRWLAAASLLAQAVAEGVSDQQLKAIITKVLSDEPRLGTPKFFSVEIVVQIVAIACESPQEDERPISHWSARELASEAVKRGIVEKVSPRSVGRFLKGSKESNRTAIGTGSTLIRMIRLPEEEQVRTICQLHQQAVELFTQDGIHLISTDEMTGIQALERAHPTKPMRIGLVERQEFEYIRHDTQSGKSQLGYC